MPLCLCGELVTAEMQGLKNIRPTQQERALDSPTENSEESTFLLCLRKNIFAGLMPMQDFISLHNSEDCKSRHQELDPLIQGHRVNAQDVA